MSDENTTITDKQKQAFDAIENMKSLFAPIANLLYEKKESAEGNALKYRCEAAIVALDTARMWAEKAVNFID